MKMIEKYEKLIVENSVNHQLLQYIDNKNIKNLFQYRSLEGFWNIIESDSIWARNIRFSNDEQERRQGIDILSAFSRKNHSGKIEDEHDYFMICFCEEDDILSQWRGYAPDGGVSMCFEINSQLPYEIVSGTDKINIVLKPHQVIYLEKDNTRESNKIFKRISANESRFSPSKGLRENMLSLIPFLKDKGFIEEKEWRIIISETFNNIDSNEFKKCIKFEKYEHLKIPYLIVKAGNSELEKFPSKVKLQIFEQNMKHTIMSAFNDINSKRKDKIEVVDCYNGVVDSEYCLGCTRSVKMYDIHNDSQCVECKNSNDYLGIDTSINSITITQGKDQKEVFELIDTYVNKLNLKNIKIWCEGHLPLRSVTVSPCENREYVSENIKNYFKNSDNYWLRYVDVKKSKIPFRSKLK